MKAASTSADIPLLEWWKRNETALPNWSKAAKKILLLQSSSASAEKVFSILKYSFGDQQENALQDYIYRVIPNVTVQSSLKSLYKKSKTSNCKEERFVVYSAAENRPLVS